MLYQLSYAPRLRGGLYRRSRGLTRGVSEPGNDNHATNRDEDEQ